MKSNSISFFVLLLALTASTLTTPSFAAVGTNELIAEALKKNPEIRFYEAEIEAAHGGRKAAGQIANPELSLEGGRIKSEDRSGNLEGDGPVWRVSISQVIDFPGRIALRKAIADRDIDLATLGLNQFKNLLTNEVRARAGDVVLLKRREAAARTVRERLAALIEVLFQRDPGTVSARLERRILEASLLTSDRVVTDAEKSRREASAMLSILCGRGADTDIDVEDTAPAFPVVPSMDALKQMAANNNFDLQQKRLAIARQGLKVDLAKSERWGNITFGPYLASEKTEYKDTQAGIGFSVPLPLWNRNKGNIQAEQARVAQAEALLATTLRDLERDLAIARAAYDAELKALEHWKAESEKEFSDAAAEADQHFRLGAVPAATYVEMQRGYLDAMDALIQGRQNAWKHRMELERLIGTTLTAEGRK